MKHLSRSLLRLASVLMLLFVVLSPFAQTLSLAGKWQFSLDPKGEGRDARWYERTLTDEIQMPASCEERGFGLPYEKPTVGRLTRVRHYEGQAWYQKEFTLPSSWQGRRVELFLERCHWETNVWIDGRFVGMQNTRLPMVVAVFQNLFNIAASLLFVFVFHWQVKGVAAGTVLAQYAGLAAAAGLLYKHFGKWKKFVKWKNLFNFSEMSRFFKVNTDIFFRTLCLVSVNFFFLSAGARQGNLILAVNTLLTQLYILFSFFMDGFAFAGEAMCGKYYGAADRKALHDTVRHLFGWGTLLMIVFVLIYLIGGQHFLNLLTDDVQVSETSMTYLVWALAVPVVGMAAFVWDGVFIGLTATKGMLLSSAIATIVFFVLFFSLPKSWGNHALWFAFVTYLGVRGAVQTILYPNIVK